jgi:hypothetical protein
MRARQGIIAVVAVVIATGAALFSTGSTRAPARASIRPENFVRHVTNPFFPLKPGTLLVYRGIKDGRLQTDRVFVTYRHKTILGVRTTVVRDIAKHRSRVLEKTFDWYAQDKQGNVWYFGENTKAFENGHVDTEGSWKAGVNGARPGILMEADPLPPDAYRQEFYKGHAEDMAWVINRGGHVRVPYGRLGPKLVTLEFSRLEPKVVDKKVYVRGFGIVREIGLTGPKETAELYRVKRP